MSGTIRHDSARSGAPERIEFFVEGKPIPQPRPRFRKAGGRPYQTKAVVAWKRTVHMVALQARAWIEREPAAMRLVFLFERPKAHLTEQKLPSLKASAPVAHNQVPDTENLSKAVLDGLKGALYVDDAQVGDLHSTKLWAPLGDRQGCFVALWLWYPPAPCDILTQGLYGQATEEAGGG